MSKVLVSIEDGLLKRIDRKARARGLSRSAYLADLVRRDLSRGGPSLEATFARLERLFAGAPAEDAAEAIRAERDSR